MTTIDRQEQSQELAVDYDAIVIGAGFGGLYALHKLHELGYQGHLIEAGDGVGGTWYWNRYPGARCDLDSIEYSYSFDPRIEQEWNWTEVMPAQAEIERYLNFVADRLDLRPDIELETRVTALTWDETHSVWAVETDRGDRYSAYFVIAATGCLSAPLTPEIPGIDRFSGITLYTNNFPREGFDFAGQRVGIVGTGSSGVQTIPVIAAEAEHLTVFQRSAAYTRPSNNRPLRSGELEELKANYAELRAAQRDSMNGVVRFGGALVPGDPPARRILETPPEQRTAVLDDLGWSAPSAWSDVMTDMEANHAATDLYAELIRRAVRDADVAKALIPHYPMGCKRQIIDTDYFETFNRDNVSLVDLRKNPILEVTPTGIRTEDGEVELDVIVYATGFDTMTGALNRIDIRGAGGTSLREFWEREGPQTYLGLQVAGFPNLFTVTGPLSPSVLVNMVMGVEHHVEWIADCLDYLREHGLQTIEPTSEAQEAWVTHSNSLMEGSIRTDPSCNSWYVGSNVPGKKRVYMAYAGGFPQYRERCAGIASAGYEGFTLA